MGPLRVPDKGNHRFSRGRDPQETSEASRSHRDKNTSFFYFYAESSLLFSHKTKIPSDYIKYTQFFPFFFSPRLARASLGGEKKRKEKTKITKLYAFLCKNIKTHTRAQPLPIIPRMRDQVHKKIRESTISGCLKTQASRRHGEF